MTNTNQITIRSLHFIEELEEVRKLESSIWGENDSIPTHQTLTAVKNGGLVLGAYDDQKLVGFQYSFPGFDGNSLYLCSHMLGIDHAYRNKGIGNLLKIAQREEALKLGYTLITWTYDPLESVNGYLNIAKLGGICSHYIENCYGEMDDLLNNGIPSDRFLVEWHISNDTKTVEKLDNIELNRVMSESIIQWEQNEEGFPVPGKQLALASLENELAFVAIPKDFRSIRDHNSQLAQEWRMITRSVFTKLFSNGWKVIDFHKNNKTELPVQFYVLSK
jgi:predicted GNAT superfamily acetyltransferase